MTADLEEQQQRGTFSSAPLAGYGAGRRSITNKAGVSRFEIMRRRDQATLRNRPFIIAALVFVLVLMAIPGWGFYQTYVQPPQEIAVQVADTIYTRGDVVDYIRFSQRLSEDLGLPFELGSSAFEMMQQLQSNELAYHLAPRYGITVEQHEIDQRVEDLLGFVQSQSGDSSASERSVNVAESKRQFLNRVGLTEESYRDFIRKTMFKERLRTEVASNLSRIVPHAEVYQIVLYDRDQGKINQIDRDLASGRSVAAIVEDFSEDPNKLRGGAYLGWLPQGVRTDLDTQLFGRKRNDDGSAGDRILPLRTLSVGNYDEATQSWIGHIVSDFTEAREVTGQNFEVLATLALDKFIFEHRTDFFTSISLNSEIYDWVNRQVRSAAIVPTPTPVSAFQSLEDLGGATGGRQ